MAAPAYTTDLLTYNDVTSITGWSEPTGMTDLNGAGEVDGDLAIYGTVCISEAMRKTTLGALVFTGTQPTWTAGTTHYFVWFKWFAPNSLGSKANGGLRVLIGNTAANYRGWYMGGAETYEYGGWENYVVDPTETTLATQTQGSPTTTYNTVGFGVFCPTSTPQKGNAYTIDIIRYGRGESRFTDGDLANGYATFAGYAAVNDNPTTGRFGLIQDQGGSYLWKGLMSLGLSGTSVDMRDSNVVLNIDDTEMVGTDFNRIEVHNASSNIEWTSVLISSLGTRAKGEFEVIDNATVSLNTCVFTDMSTFIFQSNSALEGVTWRRCGLVTQGSASVDVCTFVDSQNTVSLLSNNPTLVQGNFFTTGSSAATNHAMELSTATAGNTYSLSGNTFEGYNTVDGSTGNEVIYNNSGGAVTLNVSDTTGVVSVRNGTGATTTINNNVSITLSGLRDSTEVRVLAFGTNTELAGIENATDGTVDDRSFTFSLAASTATTIVIHNLAYVYISINYTLPGTTSTVPIQQQPDRYYNNP